MAVTQELSTELDFSDLAPVRVKVTGPDKKKYILCEASEGAVAQMRNKAMSNATFGADGKPTSVKDIGEVQPLLVSLCLFEANEVNLKCDCDTSKGARPVGVALVKSWPSRVVKELFKQIKAISDGLEEEPENAEEIEREIAKLRARLDGLRGSEGQERRGGAVQAEGEGPRQEEDEGQASAEGEGRAKN